MAIELGKHAEFLAFIEARLPELTGRYDNYRRDYFNEEKISFLQEIGDTEEAERLIHEHLDIVDVRQAEVDKLIARRDFANAKKMIADGITLAAKNGHPGTVTKWEKVLLQVALLEDNLASVREYCKKLAFHPFDGQYYRQWRKTYAREEWREIIEQVIADITQQVNQEYAKNNWGSVNRELIDALAPIYIEEQYLDRLLNLVKNEKKLDILMWYHKHLLAQYPEELLKMYLPALELDGDTGSNRDHYAALTAKMKQIIKDIPSGREQVLAVAKTLKLKYPRRPAMIDELNKLLVK